MPLTSVQIIENCTEEKSAVEFDRAGNRHIFLPMLPAKVS